VHIQSNGIHFIIVLAVASVVAAPAFAQESQWKELDTQIEQLQKQGKNDESLPLAKEAVRMAEARFGPEHLNTATALHRLGAAFIALGSYPEAEPVLQRALAIREKSLGPEAAAVAESLNLLGQLCYLKGDHKTAETFYKRALEIQEKVLGPENPDVAESLNDLAMLYEERGRFAEAEPMYQRAVAIDEKALGPECSELVDILNDLGNLYDDQGRYTTAEPFHKRALDIAEKVLGPNHPDVAMALSNLAILYVEQGRYREAEPLYKRGLAIYEKNFGPDHPSVAVILNNLAFLYYSEGRYADADALYKRALAINEKALGQDHPTVATNAEDLAVLYTEQGRYSEAEALDNRVLAIRMKAFGAEDPDVAMGMTNLGFIYVKQGKYAEGEPLFRHALAILEKTYGPDHPSVATLLLNFGLLYYTQGRYAEAEPLYKRALAIAEKALGPDHPGVATGPLYSLSKLYYAEGRYDQAEPLFQRSFAILRNRFDYNFAYMSERDRLQFLRTVQSFFPLYLSFSFAQSKQDAGVAGRMYDLLLWQKGMVSTSEAALRAQVAASRNKQALDMFEELTSKKSQSSRLAVTRPPGWQEARTRADAEANDLEGQLARLVNSFAEQKTLARTTWQDVRNALRPDEAAVEFARFSFDDGRSPTAKPYYIALVIRPQSPHPELIQLGEAHDLEGESFSAYRAEVGSRGVKPSSSGAQAPASPWRGLYDALWKPLEPALRGAHRIYISPDGALNEIPPGILEGVDSRRVMEKYDVRIVSSTRDLLRPNHPASSNTAILVGNPRFLMSDEEQRVAVNRLRISENPQQANLLTSAELPSNPMRGTVSRDATVRGACDPPPPDGGVLCPLPATGTEIQSIGRLLRGKNWVVSSYQGEQALEEVVKGAVSPRVLHVATHGFFLSDQQVKRGEGLSGTPVGLEDPMLRSGLFFAGADRVLKSETPVEGVENGVLTAYEATALNLQGTELVVLSACETGRGHVQNGEGVFGLRRALQEAGAEAVLMSLWSVPDRETQELMTLFYENWLNGMEKPEALRHAQIFERDRVRKRYGKDLPYYWGAFILVGR
jgi:tetratricopeptide (TPR) repeat protein/CHAT domain-containing protein